MRRRFSCRGGTFWRSYRDWEGTRTVHPWFRTCPARALSLRAQVLLKTNDEEKRYFLKHFIHQANVNRDKVVRCILGNEAKVRQKAKQLFANGIPLELISLLPNDNSFEKLHVQNAATPGDAMKDPDKIKQSSKGEGPNAVVLERSSAEGADIEEMRT
jgi:hypothetical protein